MSGQFLKIFNTTMGNCRSSKYNPSENQTSKQNSRSDMQSNNASDNSREHPLEDPEIIKLKKNIKNNPEVFILNNLMMCVDFFHNYDEEILEMRKTLVSPNETDLNKRLLPQKRVLLPDILQERVVKNVTFISRRETVDPTMEPLQPVRMFVVYENIEVSDQHDSSQYSSMNDTITYNMRLKPSKNKGYVHLERMGVIPTKIKSTVEEVDLSSIAENGDECYSDSESFYSKSNSSESKERRSRSRSKNNQQINSNMAKSTPNLNESVQVYQRLPTSRSKTELENDEIDYGFVSDSRSSQGQRSVSREPRRQKRGLNRNSQHPLLKTRSVSASPASSTSSGYKSSNYDIDSEYGYSTSNKSKSPLDIAEMPDSCFSQVTKTLEGGIYDPLENQTKRIISSKERQVQVERNRQNYDVWYLNSTRFRKRFYNVFIESLAPLLGLEEVIRFRRPLFFGSVVYCDKVEISPTAKCNICESYEIIPCIWTQWPECANEWLERTRHSWPNYETIRQIIKFGCYIIPQECRSKDDHFSSKTEWQLAFPAAERYLETCMSHSQMRVYIIALMLHKTFIRAVESAPDRLNAHQIRNQLFWLMEYSVQDWSENKTGDYLIKLLQCLCECINQDEAFLKDYFLEEKNLFKNSEKGSLFFSLKQLKRILENPVMYVLHALENIRYKSEFFPKLNYEELLKILTIDELLLINPNLQKDSAPIMKQVFMEDEYSVRRGFWDDAKKNKEHFSNLHRRPVTNKTLINPSRAHDAVVDIAIRCGELKGIRLSKLLNFFIEHLIKMGEKYHEYGAVKQKNEYLQHAMSLSILLAEDEMFREDARSQIREIVSLQRLITTSTSRDDPPETPKRNPEMPIFTSTSRNTNPSTSSSISSSNPEANSQEEFLERSKKKSDTSPYSVSLKDRYSSPSNQSSKFPTEEISRKKSDPPVYFQSFNSRFSNTSSDDTAALSPTEENISREVPIAKREKDNLPELETKKKSCQKQILNSEEETTKETINRVGSSKTPEGNIVKQRMKIYSNSEDISEARKRISDPISMEREKIVPSDLVPKGKNDVLGQSDQTPKKNITSVQVKKFEEKKEITSQHKKIVPPDPVSKEKKDFLSQSDEAPEENKTSVQIKISEEKTNQETTSQDNSSVSTGRVSVKDRIKIYSSPKEVFAEAKKKISQESKVISLTDDSSDSSKDTYI
ncbi:uncharacterized protein LOC122510309 [Leptopilina heterotoma]|uniref:uncharacterized protein LOC122510309 n=1 Tax=Leptopilina heterotoma TaxID=63436 RepID=UPI001CA9507F|nr:uncharacterized protein LOC122510309 [Leptopilina heterotoma]